MASLLLCSLLVLLCVGHVMSIQFSFKGNITNPNATIAAKGWQYRSLQFTSFSNRLWLGANYVSASITKGNGTISEDAVAGAVYVVQSLPPFAFAGYFEAEASWTRSPGPDNTFAISSNFSSSAGYVGNNYLYLLETSPNGTVVYNQSLKHAAVNSAAVGLTWSLIDNTRADDDLKSITLTGSLPATNTTISISFIASSKIGVLNQGEAIVGPKNIETLIEIVNWPYQAPNNTLSLVMGVGLGQINYTASATALIPLNATEQIYFALSDKVWLGSKSYKANISINLDSVANIENPNFASALLGRYGGNATYSIVTVTFPAGASDILYDPSVGAGVPVTDATVDPDSTVDPTSTSSTSSTTTTTGAKSSATKSFAGLAVAVLAVLAAFL